MQTTTNVQRLVTLAILSAVAYLLMFVTHELNFIPSAPFLSLDMKDMVLVIGGFLYGPMAAFMMTLVVCLLEMLTVSSTGFIGLVMNILASSAFACSAAFIYRRRQTLDGAVIGLVVGCLMMTATMLLWNYIVTPMYQGVPRPAIAAMLIPVFLPFNLIKSGLNAAIALVLYKPVVGALRRARLAPPSGGQGGAKVHVGMLLAAVAVIGTLVLIILAYRGVI